jgi:hypothetical protein
MKTLDDLVAERSAPGDEYFTKHLIRLYRGDFARVARLHNTKRPNEIIRNLVREHCLAMEAQRPSTAKEKRRA